MRLIFFVVFDRLDRVKRARIDATESMGSDAQDGYLSLQDGVSALSDDMDGSMSMMMSEVDISLANLVIT